MIDIIKNSVRKKYWHAAKLETKLEDFQSKMRVNLKDIPHDGIMVNFPCEKNPHSTMIKECSDYKKFCDALIFIPKVNFVNVYLIEMKKSFDCDREGDLERARKQLISTKPIADYLHSIVKNHSDNKKEIENYFLVILTYRKIYKLNKQSTKEKIFETRGHGDKKIKIIFLPPDIPPDIEFRSLK